MTRVTCDPIQRLKGQRSRSPCRLTPCSKTNQITEREGLETRFNTDGQSTTTRGDLRPESSGWLLKVTTCRGRGHIVAAPLQAARLVIVFCLYSEYLSRYRHAVYLTILYYTICCSEACSFDENLLHVCIHAVRYSAYGKRGQLV